MKSRDSVTEFAAAHKAAQLASSSARVPIVLGLVCLHSHLKIVQLSSDNQTVNSHDRFVITLPTTSLLNHNIFSEYFIDVNSTSLPMNISLLSVYSFQTCQQVKVM